MKFLQLIISFFSRTLNIIGVFFLLVCLSASYINPERFSLIPLLGFAFPIFVLINFLFVLIWLLRLRWFFLISLIALIISSPQIFHLIAFGKNKPMSNEQIKVMSYNVRNFDLYNWSENLNAQDRIFETIEEENPDIICFQEFYSDTSKNFNTIKRLQKLGYKYYFFARELILRNADEWGIATFSKYPIIKSEKILKQKEATTYGKFPYKCIYTDIQYKKNKLRVFNIHLQSVHFGKNEYDVIDNLKKKDIEESAAKRLLRKLKTGFQKRANQANALRKILDQQTEPYILCGDFNDLPNSYVYNHISENLKDTFLQNSIGVGQTFNKIPFLRIDYILMTNHFKSNHFKVIHNPISDHYPIATNIQF